MSQNKNGLASQGTLIFSSSDVTSSFSAAVSLDEDRRATFSRITITWINLMYQSLKDVYQFPPWHVVKKYLPERYHQNTHIIIDATKFAIERPSSLVSQSSRFSPYKNRNIVKVYWYYS